MNFEWETVHFIRHIYLPLTFQACIKWCFSKYYIIAISWCCTLWNSFLWQIFHFSKRFSLRCRCVQVHFEFPLKCSHGSFSAERIWTMIKPLSQMIIFVNLDIYRRYNQCNVVSTKPLLSLVEFHLSSVKCTISKSNLSVLNTTALYCFFTAILSVWFVLMPRCLLALHQSTCFKWAPKPGWLIYLSA